MAVMICDHPPERSDSKRFELQLRADRRPHAQYLQRESVDGGVGNGTEPVEQ